MLNLDVIIGMNMHGFMEIRLLLGKCFRFSKTEANQGRDAILSK